MEENNIEKSDGKDAGRMIFPEFAGYVRDNLRNGVLHVAREEAGKMVIPSFDKMIFHGDFNYGGSEGRDMAYKKTDRMMKDCADRMDEGFQSGFAKPQRDFTVDSIIREYGYECTAYVLSEIIQSSRSLVLELSEENIWAHETSLEISRVKPGFHYVRNTIQPEEEALKAFTRIFRERSRQHNYELADFLTEGMTPMLTNDMWFNGEPLSSTGIYFQNKQVFGAVTPVIPLQKYYDSYLHSLGKSTTGLEEALYAVARDALLSADLMPGMMEHMELTAERNPAQLIYLKAVNTAANPTQDSGSMRMLRKWMGDISLQMQMVSFDRNGNQTAIALRGFHQKLLGSTVDELYRLAMENTRSLFPPVIRTMGEILKEFTGVNTDPGNERHMHIITNSRKFEAASYMFDPSVLSEVSAAYGGDNLFLMPSSIHESIAMPADVVPDAEDLALIVREVNESRVSVEERLSNTVYLYDAMDLSIRPAAGLEYGDIRDPELKTLEPGAAVILEPVPNPEQQRKMKSPGR